jgi:DNA-binding NarL/FixJ family response regulator
MSATEYSGPDRRRGGPDRRNLDEVTRIHVVDDHALFRMGIANILGREPDFEIVAEAEDRAERRSRSRDLARHHPDGPVAAVTGRHRDDPADQARLPSTGIIVLAQTEDEDACSTP